MIRNIVKLSRGPFCIDAGKGHGWYFIEPQSGDLKFGSAVMRASKGLSFGLSPEADGVLLRLQYADIVMDIGWTADAVDAASWVDAVNRFLETKREPAVVNGTPMPTMSTGSAV
jgi:hypothetical protein